MRGSDRRLRLRRRSGPRIGGIGGGVPRGARADGVDDPRRRRAGARRGVGRVSMRTHRIRRRHSRSRDRPGSRRRRGDRAALRHRRSGGGTRSRSRSDGRRGRRRCDGSRGGRRGRGHNRHSGCCGARRRRSRGRRGGTGGDGDDWGRLVLNHATGNRDETRTKEGGAARERSEHLQTRRGHPERLPARPTELSRIGVSQCVLAAIDQIIMPNADYP